MKDNIKVVTFGCGFMGRNVTRFMKERGGFDHVACIGRKSHLGEDIGEVSGVGPVGAKIYPVTDLGKRATTNSSPMWSLTRAAAGPAS